MRWSENHSDEAGSSMVEVVVAMVLLGLIAMGMLPMFITGLRVSVQSAERVSAVSAVNAQVEKARANPTCAGLSALVSTGTPFSTGSETLSLVTSLPGGCMAGTAGLVTVTVVAQTSSGVVRSSATTQVYVTS